MKILTEPYVILTSRGYAPVVDVAINGEADSKVMFISSVSMSQALEDFRLRNGNRFSGIHIKVRKESTDKFAKYIIEEA